jgi:uncharacterized protein GlcG (DUF336 family)
MKVSTHHRLIVAGGTAALVIAGGLAFHRPAANAQGASVAASGPSITAADREKILSQGVAQAGFQPSAFRPSATTRMHIAIVDRGGRLIGFRSMADAWEGSRDIAIAKARTAAFFSSNQNALTSRTIGVASQAHFPDATGGAGPLWGIGESNKPGITGNANTRNGLITFPGGLPLYKRDANNQPVLVGGVGVSGDSVDADEAVAIRAAVGFEAPDAIKSSTVIGPVLPYTLATPATPPGP